MSVEPALQLLDQQTAIEAYLDSQLHPHMPVEELKSDMLQEDDSQEEMVELPVHAPIKTIPLMTLDEHGIALWPDKPFACQIVKTASLKLAIPLAEYSSFSRSTPWPDELIQIADSHPALLGQTQYKDRDIKVVDPARLVIPEERQAALLDNVSRKFASILLAEEQGWGLACDEVAEVITIDPQMVHWRNPDSKRLWIAGTVMQHGYALLDTDAISGLFEQL